MAFIELAHSYDTYAYLTCRLFKLLPKEQNHMKQGSCIINGKQGAYQDLTPR
jgi:hypothetical protein